MRVCFVDRIGAHAIWGVLAPVAERLVAEGHAVDFVRMDDGGDRGRSFIPDKVRVFDLPVPRKRGPLSLIGQQLAFVREFRKLLRQIRPDIVHTNFAVPSIAARWAAAREGVPLIVSTQHELYGSMHPHYRWGLRLTERYCAAVVYVSNTVARTFGRTADKVEETRPGQQAHVVIPNGVDIDRIRSAIAGVGGRVPGRIVCAGRMVPVKGQHLLIEALPEALRQHPHLHVRLVGAGPMEESLRRRVAELGLTDNVSFLGWLPHDEVLREMAAAELAVVPSSQEGFGLVVAEALVCGAPLLVSDIPVFGEVLEGAGGQNLFFAAGDAQDLAKKLIGFPFAGVGKPTESIATEVERLSSDATADAYVRLYQALCACC